MSHDTALTRIFPGESEMARRMRSFDWTRTPLGPPGHWPLTLRTCVRIMLTSRQPMFVWWGEQSIQLYNGGCARFLHRLHPWALGQPAAEVWPEIWPQIAPRVEFARQQESGTYDEAQPFVLYRKGYPEETYVSISYSPILDDGGGFGGLLCPVADETQRVVGKRRAALLRELATRTAHSCSLREACTLAAASLASDTDDLPFALIYLRDAEARTFTLTGRANLPGKDAAPQAIDPQTSPVWQIADALEARRSRIVDIARVVSTSPRVRDIFPLTHAVVVPLLAGARVDAEGLLIAGLNPLRQYDEEYERFLELAGRAISTALGGARGQETNHHWNPQQPRPANTINLNDLEPASQAASS